MADMMRKNGPAVYGCGCSTCANKQQRRNERKRARRREERTWQRDHVAGDTIPNEP